MKNNFKIILDRISEIQKNKHSVIIALDGRCAAGKTTFAMQLSEVCECNVFHMDDFFLRSEQRTPERLNTPGGNVDRERVLKEIVLPLLRGDDVEFYPYDCATKTLKNGVFVPYKNVNIIEGAYSCHPDLFDYFDIHIFLDVSPEEQLSRIKKRNGIDAVQNFKKLWIPLEEKYFSFYDIREKCEFVF